MKRLFKVSVLLSLFLVGCSNKPTLQKYFVDNTENKNFIALDISPTILKLDKTKLSLQQKEALESFDKMNILAFKLNDKNKVQFDQEKAKVANLLKDKKYQELMRFNSGKEGASVCYVGDEEHIEEFVLFANKKENGFAVIRILGKDMNPTGIMTLISVLKSSNIDLEQLKPLEQLMIKK